MAQGQVLKLQAVPVVLYAALLKIHPITKDMNDPVSEAFYAELEIVVICCQTQIWWKIS